MRDMDDDEDLRQQFAHLAREDRARMIPFSAVGRAAAHQQRALARSSGPRILALVTGAIAVVALVLLSDRWAQTDRGAQRPILAPVALPVREWRSPTDFLLHTPGAEWLRSVPEIGERAAWTRLPGGRDDSSGAPTHSDRRTS